MTGIGVSGQDATVPQEAVEAARRAASEWEVFTDSDGGRSIRKRDERTPEQIADDVLAAALPVLRAHWADRIEAWLVNPEHAECFEDHELVEFVRGDTQ